MSRRRPFLAAAAAATFAALSTGMSAGAADSGGRLQGTWAMKGKITRADNVRGERKGQRIKREWRFSSTCPSGPCKTVKLTRERSAGQKDTTVLKRVRRNFYSGKGRFYVRLRCNGKVYPRGGLATMTLTVKVTRSAMVQGKSFATGMSATYDNPKRVNRTPCAGGIGRDAATYTGSLSSSVPTPPGADFNFSSDTLTTTVSFTDTTTRGESNASLKKWSWDFGDAGSGANTSAKRNPTHQYSAPGTYTVKLTVTDANGLTDTFEQEVTASA